MTGDFDDDLTRRLSGLSADLDGVSLAGPSAARARAARRNRHQVTGGVLAGVAAVAAGVAIISPPDLTTTPDPAPPASLSTPAPTDPATTTTEVALSAALLTPADLEPLDDAPWSESRDRTDVVCDPAPVLASLSSTVDRAAVTYAASDGNSVRQDLVRFGTATSADDLWAEMRSCLPAQGEGDAPVVTDEYRLSGVGDEGWLIRYYTDPAAEDSDAVTAALVRYQDVVSLTVRTQPRADTVGAELDTGLPVAAAQRMCDTVFGESCVGEPALEDLTGSGPTSDPADDPADEPTGGPTGGPADDPTEPADDPTAELLGLADDPMLTDGDLAAVGTATGFVRRPEMDVSAPYAPCLQDPAASGADTSLALGFNHDLDATIVEWALQMPDAGTASGMVESHTVLPEVCGEVGENRVQTVGEPVVVEIDGADDAVVWTVRDDPAPGEESSSSFAGIGIARVSNIVVAIAFSAMDDPSGGDWPGVVTPLLATALQRAVG